VHEHDRIELESKLALPERTVDALNGELIAHARRIDLLQERLDALVAHVRREASRSSRTTLGRRTGAAESWRGRYGATTKCPAVAQ